MTTAINGTAGNDLIQAHAAADSYAGQLVFVLGGMPAQGGWPTVNVLINGQTVLANVLVSSDVMQGQTQLVSVALPAGVAVSSVGLRYTNDLVTTADDRNVYVGSVTLNGHPLELAAATYVRDDYPTIAGQHDMDWNGNMTWSGSAVQTAMSTPTHADNASIDAGAGLDTVLYHGRASDYTVGFTGSGFTVAPLSGAWSADTVTNAENLLFDDLSPYGGGYSLAVDANAGTIDAGTGIDTLFLRGTHDQYHIDHTDSGFSIAGNGVQEWVTNVERLGFSDGFLGLDIDGNGGVAYRIYQAAFARTPDAGGVGFWINAMDNGMSLETVAANFIASAEFQATYGNVDTDQFVTLLYQNVLHRAPDAGGLDFWENVLDSGQHSRAWVLAGFSESTENQANVIGAIQDGFYFNHSGW